MKDIEEKLITIAACVWFWEQTFWNTYFIIEYSSRRLNRFTLIHDQIEYIFKKIQIYAYLKGVMVCMFIRQVPKYWLVIILISLDMRLNQLGALCVWYEMILLRRLCTIVPSSHVYHMGAGRHLKRTHLSR